MSYTGAERPRPRRNPMSDSSRAAGKADGPRGIGIDRPDGESSMRDETCLRRQWTLLRALTSRRLGLTIGQMADELGVTSRTIRRDLEVFRSVGFPLEEAVGEFGRKTWSIKAGRDQPPLAFTYDEVIALHLGRRMLEPLAGTPVRRGRRGGLPEDPGRFQPGGPGLSRAVLGHVPRDGPRAPRLLAEVRVDRRRCNSRSRRARRPACRIARRVRRRPPGESSIRIAGSNIGRRSTWSPWPPGTGRSSITR